MEQLTRFLDDASDAFKKGKSFSEATEILKEKTLDAFNSKKEKFYTVSAYTKFDEKLATLFKSMDCDKDILSKGYLCSTSSSVCDASEQEECDAGKTRNMKWIFAYCIHNMINMSYATSNDASSLQDIKNREERFFRTFASQCFHEKENPLDTPFTDVLTYAFLKFMAENTGRKFTQ